LLVLAAQYDKAQLELGGLHSSWSVVVLLGAFYAVVGGAIVALDAAALGTRTASGASAPARALVAGAGPPLGSRTARKHSTKELLVRGCHLRDS